MITNILNHDNTNCGYFAESTTLTAPNLKFKYWSTAIKLRMIYLSSYVPRIAISFFSSTITSLPSKLLKNETNIYLNSIYK